MIIDNYSNLYRVRTVICTSILWFVLVGSSAAQNMQVIGGSSIAAECYRVSASAALTKTASSRDIGYCDRALQHGALGKRDKVATYVNRGVLNVALNNYQDAAQDYNYAIKLDPDVAEAYLNRGNLWLIAERYDQAIGDYDKAMELDVNKFHIALMNKGMAYEGKGDFSLAKDLYEAALNKRQDWPTAKSRLERLIKKIAKSSKS